MRYGAIGVLAVGMGLAGCTMVRMQGFDAVAARGERLDLHGLPLLMSGDFRIGTDGTRGHVHRESGAASDLAGFEEGRPARFDQGYVARGGLVRFDVAGPAVPGRLAGQCTYDREERRLVAGPLTLSAPSVPLHYACRFTADGVPAGELVLDAAPAERGARSTEPRTGRLRYAGGEWRIASEHHGVDTRWPVSPPLGYTIADAGGVVAAVEVNGLRARRLVLPPAPGAARQAALAAGIALALFQDPGDTD